jgi:hypothetical protein
MDGPARLRIKGLRLAEGPIGWLAEAARFGLGLFAVVRWPFRFLLGWCRHGKPPM